MKIQFSDRAKQSIQGGQGKQEECSPPDSSREAFNALLQEVGARTRMEDGKPVLCFEPPLEREEVEPERWAKAQKLERRFWVLCEEHGY
jgi:hypothetical protein